VEPEVDEGELELPEEPVELPLPEVPVPVELPLP
jgi:hypothetical protein